MKLPSSSSVFLATLAISSSSSSLAAPTGPGETSLASSSSNHHLSFHRGSYVSRGVHSPGTIIKRRSDRIVERSLVSREPLDADLVSSAISALRGIPGIGPLLATTISKILGVGTKSIGVDAVQGISAEDLDNLKSAIAQFSAALVASDRPTLVPAANTDTGAGPTTGGLAAPLTTSSTPSSSATPVAAAAAVDASVAPSNSTSAASSAPTGANAPTVALPLAVTPPTLPVPVPVAPPAAPVNPPAAPPAPPAAPANAPAAPANAPAASASAPAAPANAPAATPSA